MKKMYILLTGIFIFIIMALPAEAGKRKLEISNNKFPTTTVNSDYIDGLRQIIADQNLEISTLKNINQLTTNQNTELEKRLFLYRIWACFSVIIVILLASSLILIITKCRGLKEENYKLTQRVLHLKSFVTRSD